MRILVICLVILGCTSNNTREEFDPCPHVYTPEHKANSLQASNAQMERQTCNFPNVLMTVPTSYKVAFLTFDDGPSKYTAELLDSLYALNAKATFFVLGQRALQFPEIMDGLVHHAVGNHTYDHKPFRDLSALEIKDQIEKTDRVLASHRHATDIIRIPWGNITDERIPLVGRKTIVHWDINTDDWYFNKIEHGEDSIANRIIDHIHPGAIILAHDGGGDRHRTIQGVSKAVRLLKRRGWQFIELSPELVRLYTKSR